MGSKKIVAELKSKYAYRDGARYPISADVVGVELERIHAENGVIRPRDVVDAARPDEAPLHPVFEWRDGVAADKYRDWQARMLTKSVVVLNEGGKPDSKQAYIHVSQDAETDRGYQPIDVVVSRPDMYATALGDLMRKFSAAKESVEALKRAAEQSPETDHERMSRIAIAVQAMQTASAAVAALH